MDSVSHLIRLARLRGAVDKRCLLAGDTTIDNGARPAGEAPFHLLLEGECTLELADRSVDLVAGDVVLLPRGRAHRVRTRGRGRRRAVVEEAGGAFPTARSQGTPSEIDLFCGHYAFGPGAGDLLFQSLPDPLHVSFGAESGEPVRMLSALMRGEAQNDGPGATAIVISLCDALLAMVLRSTSNRRLAGDALWTAVDDERLRAVVDAVLGDPGRDWTIPDLAGLAAMSRATFIRRFTRATGMTAGDFLTRVRMMTAAEMLTAGDRPIGVVAAEVGYQSESAFGRAFRTATGATPARFRRTATRS
ncbi:cupin domain-containing protein [Planotetraspora kaengkrachanensis]|uniref:Putative HTH-type transcriptional regulator n=1 Tax=Planotetraspora kaengkrachanensis TaxID=575193 RepID=A0A8J3VBV5_9ACTN|nr:AraC family transcriptional regulator [Planotetraspora kaengkrachanensis]GIG83909.1 putative HTH-type transcriptional regulator [Planotetraspora kaengkrachanensis]